MIRSETVFPGGTDSRLLKDEFQGSFDYHQLRTDQIILWEEKMEVQRTVKILLVIAVLSAAAVGCLVTGSKGSMESRTETIPLEGVDKAVVELRMGAGELSIQSGKEALMEGQFRYSNSNYAPVIDYTTNSGSTGELIIEQKEVTLFNLGTDYRLEWDLTLNENVRLDLDVALGAGTSSLDLTGLNLSALEMDLGAGEVEVSLGGNLSEDLAVDIQGGVGELTVTLPDETPIRAEVAGGLGEIKVEGLSRDGGAYTSQEYGTGPAIELDIEGGVGQVNLLVR